MSELHKFTCTNCDNIILINLSYYAQYFNSKMAEDKSNMSIGSNSNSSMISKQGSTDEYTLNLAIGHIKKLVLVNVPYFALSYLTVALLDIF